MTVNDRLPADWQGKYYGLNPLEKVHEGEPWFFLRAQDATAPGALEGYANTLNAISHVARTVNDDPAQARLLHLMALDCFKAAEAFRIWQQRNPDLVKLPD